MEDPVKIIIKKGTELTDKEEEMINEAKAREWDSPPLNDRQRESIFVLVKNGQEEILAQGQLVPIDGILFDGTTYSIFGIGGIIANQKGKGYGKILMQKIKTYLSDQHKSGIGFTGGNLIEFYEKCGFLSDSTSLSRFVHKIGGRKTRNTIQDWVFYQDSDDRFMESVLKKPHGTVFLPRDPDW